MKILLRFILAVIVIIALWAAGLAFFSYKSLQGEPEFIGESNDVIVVLTGGKGRIDEGLRLFANGWSNNLFITGVHEDVKMEEIIGQWNGEQPLPPCCLSLGYKARTTQQNAQETLEWLEGKNVRSIRLVTGNYHMPRAYMELSHVLQDITIYRHPIRQQDLTENKELLLHLLISEYHKSIFRWFALFFEPYGAS